MDFSDWVIGGASAISLFAGTFFLLILITLPPPDLLLDDMLILMSLSILLSLLSVDVAVVSLVMLLSANDWSPVLLDWVTSTSTGDSLFDAAIFDLLLSDWSNKSWVLRIDVSTAGWSFLMTIVLCFLTTGASTSGWLWLCVLLLVVLTCEISSGE